MIPKIEYPLYEIYLHSLGRKVKARPFLVKEEKILLMAKESKDEDAIRLSIDQIISNCIQEPIDVKKLPLFDVEMLFIKLRAKSIGESVKFVFNCQNMVEGQSCNTDNNYIFDLEKVQYEIPEGHERKVMVSEDIGIMLKYPNLDDGSFEDETDDYSKLLSILLNNIESIFTKETVTPIEQCSEEELKEFIESLSIDSLEKIKSFFNTSPKVVLKDKAKCSKCGFEHTIITEGLLDFFT